MQWFQEKRILVPFDFSVQAAEAVSLALQLAADQADVHVLHVCPALNTIEPAVIWDTIDDEARKEHTLAELEKRMSVLGAENVRLDVGFGDPGSVIVHLADEVGVGLIIIPSHGRTGLKRLLLGSVAERVVRLAKCPVLVLKADHK